MHSPITPDPENRRGFFKKLLVSALGAVSVLVPAGAGLALLLDPLRRKSKATGFVRVTTLEALPKDGVPGRFPVVAKRVDGWTTRLRVPVGAVFLRRTKAGVQAFTVVCPHAGCFVDWLPERKTYLCPCHESTFAIDGSVIDPTSPSPRGLDSLEVELRAGGEVWVRFHSFQAGVREKIPLA